MLRNLTGSKYYYTRKWICKNRCIIGYKIVADSTSIFAYFKIVENMCRTIITGQFDICIIDKILELRMSERERWESKNRKSKSIRNYNWSN